MRRADFAIFICQLLEFAPPGVSGEDITELWVRHKGNITIIREEVTKWWDGEFDSST